MKNKLAIICSGGGMTCAYNGGVVYALEKKYNLFTSSLLQPIIFGGSGSSGNVAYAVAGSAKSIRRVWVDLLPTRKFLNLFRFWRMMNIDYLIDTVFKKQEPLPMDKAYASSINLLIATTNSKTGKVKFFSNHTPKIDLFEVLRASKALPVFYNKKVCIKGHSYIDSYCSSSSYYLYKKAKSLGATHFIIIKNDPVHKLIDFLYQIWIYSKGPKFGKNHWKLFRTLIKNRESLKNKPNTIIISPKKILPTSFLNNTKHFLKAAYDKAAVTCQVIKRYINF